MKQKHFIIFCLLFLIFKVFGIKNYCSQTFMATRPAYFNVEAYTAFWHNMAYCNENKLTSFQFITYYTDSARNEDRPKSQRISEYFLMPCTGKLIVKGDDSPKDRNVRAEWLLLPADFNGTLSFFPQQKQVAFYAEFKHDLGKRIEIDLFRNFWFGIGISAQLVENKLHVNQNILKTINNKNITSSLNRSEISWGKFLNSKSNGFSDIRFKFGTELFPRAKDFQVNAQTYLLIPLEETQSVSKIFAAKRSFNGHWGIGSIVNLQIPLTRKDSCYLIAFCLDIEDLFLFKHHEDRIFDLKKKPWSRYLLLNSKDGERNIPAINVLTQCVKVEPFNIVDLSVGFRYKHNCLEAELTYGLWAHGDEKIKIKKNKCAKKFGIAAMPGEVTNEGLPATASKSNIADLAETDKDSKGNNIFIPITKSDIDIKSGIARETLTHRINMAIGSTYHGECLNVLWGIGGFVEIPQNNAALEQWGLWGKIGASF